MFLHRNQINKPKAAIISWAGATAEYALVEGLQCAPHWRHLYLYLQQTKETRDLHLIRDLGKGRVADFDAAWKIIKQYWKGIQEVAHQLLEKEEVYADEVWTAMDCGDVFMPYLGWNLGYGCERLLRRSSESRDDFASLLKDILNADDNRKDRVRDFLSARWSEWSDKIPSMVREQIVADFIDGAKRAMEEMVGGSGDLRNPGEAE